MKRLALVLALAAIPLAGCSATSTSTSTPTSAPAETGFFNMETLAQSIKEKTNSQKVGEPGEHLTNVTCIKTGKLTASCNGEYSNERHETVEVNIAEDGHTWVSK